jgi:O-antigen/teichoic acid export membrane protein
MLRSSWARLQSSPLLKNSVAASSGKVVFFTASLVRNLFLARLIGPFDFGTWTLGLVWLQYAQWSHFTLLNAYRLEGARSRGAGNKDNLVRLSRLTWTACVFPAALVALAACGVAYWESHAGRNAALFLAALLLPYQMYLFASTSLGVEEKFTVLARMQVIYAVLNMGLTLGLAFFWGFWGALIAQVVSYLVILIAYRKQFPLHLTPLFDWALIRNQIRIGLPIGLNGVIYTVFVTIDRTMVAYGLGLAALGPYGLTALARSSIGLLPDAISEVVYMRTSTLYGETRTVSSVLPMILQADRIVAHLAAPVIGLVVIWTPWAVHLVLPDYQSGSQALQIFLTGFFFVLPLYAGVLLTSIGKAAELSVIYMIVTCAQAMFVWLGIRSFEIGGAALGTVGGSLLLFLMMNIWCLTRVGVRAKDVTGHMLRCLAPFVVMVLGLGIGWAMMRGWHTEGRLPLRELMASGVFVLINLPLAFFGVRQQFARGL